MYRGGGRFHSKPGNLRHLRCLTGVHALFTSRSRLLQSKRGEWKALEAAFGKGLASTPPNHPSPAAQFAKVPPNRGWFSEPGALRNQAGRSAVNSLCWSAFSLSTIPFLASSGLGRVGRSLNRMANSTTTVPAIPAGTSHTAFHRLFTAPCAASV